MKVNYLSRDFEALRDDLINWAKAYHPDKFLYINDATPDIMYLEMCAYVGDMLSYYTDKTFNESFLSTAQAGTSLVRIANDLGFFEMGSTPASTQVKLSITVPPIQSNGTVIPDPEMLLSIKPGLTLSSDSGVFFEVLEEVNFADETNRKVIPNFLANGTIEDFTIEKAVVAKAGQTKIQRFYVPDTMARPFLTITLDDREVTEVLGVVSVPGNQFVAPVDEDFTDPDKAFFEVRSLVDNTKFLEINPQPQISQSLASYIKPVVKQGTQVAIPRRFIVRRDVQDILTLTFGSSSPSFNAFNSLIQTTVSNTVSLNQVLNNTALGEIPPPNSTLFIKYRVGGGEKTNVITGQLNTIVAKNFFPTTTSNLTALSTVRNSLVVRNDIPAMGGKNIPTNEEIRVSAGKIFASQDRGVTYEDIKTLVDVMPARFGRPFRMSYEEIKPRVANFQQVESGVNTLLEQLLLETTVFGRENKIQEIKNFMTGLRDGVAEVTTTIANSNPNQTITTLSTLSQNLLSVAPSLWIGEKARLYVLGITETGQLLTNFKDTNGVWVSPNKMLKENIREYLAEKRIIGDWIDIVDARVVNIHVEFTVLVDKKNKQQVLLECLNKLRDYFNINNWQINQPIFISNVLTVLQEVNGVINVVDLKFYNVFGVGLNSTDPITGRTYTTVEIGRYRNNLPTPVSAANNKFEMAAPNNIILGYPDTIFEVKYPESDIVGKAI
jgi:hypothetical protein